MFIPSITDGHVCSKEERILLSLPAKKGGLAIPIFSNIADQEFNFSNQMTEALVKNIKDQLRDKQVDRTEQNKIKRFITKTREDDYNATLTELRRPMSNDQLRANDLATMKGASSWITTLPLASENFQLNKREFYDAISIRYRWPLKYLPSTCPCGKQFDVDHALSCMKGGFVYQRHDDVRDVLSEMLKDVCKDVKTEPHLRPLTGEVLPNNNNSTDDARLDISARSFWQKGQRAFFDIRVFNPFEKSHLSRKLPTVFLQNEKEKKRQYNQRVIEVEHGSFSPLVFTQCGSCGREAERFLSEARGQNVTKRDLAYSLVMQWLRAKLSFQLLRSAILCVRGSRGLRKKVVSLDVNDVEIANAIGKIA